MASGVNGESVTLSLVGVILIYSGIKGKKISRTIQDLIKGQNPLQDPTVDQPITQPDPALSSLLTGNAGSSGPAPSLGGILSPYASGGGSVGRNRALGKVLATPMGWGTGAQWEALDWIATEESGWSNTETNPSSGAYGIPQALPPTKMPKPAQPPQYGGSSDPTTQILWMLSYIKQRYGNPVNAKAFHLANGWY